MGRKKACDQLPLMRALIGKAPSRNGAWGSVVRNIGIDKSNVPTLFPAHWDLDEIEAMFFTPDAREQFRKDMEDFVLVDIKMEIVGARLALPINFIVSTRSS